MYEVLTNEDVLEKSRRAVQWLRNAVGANTPNRYDEYLKIWNEIVRRSDLPGGGTSEEQINKILVDFGIDPYRGAVNEIFDLIHIHEVFGKTEIPTALLRKIASGRYSETEEDRDRPATGEARNFLFELSVAATFHSRRFTVRFGNDADVVFNFENHRTFIECKRLFSEEGFERNIIKVSRQLEARYKDFGLPVNLVGQIPLGIAAYSVGKIANPDGMFLNAPDAKSAFQTLDKEIERLWRRRRRLIFEKNHDNTIGTAFYIRVLGILPDGYGCIRHWRFFMHPLPGHPLHPIAKQISERLLRGAIPPIL